jgi:imidazolonepropionase-like amidohydrolase
MKMKYIYTIIALIIINSAIGQNPSPAKPQTNNILIMGGRIHLGNGKVLQNGSISIINGKMESVTDLDNNKFKDTSVSLKGPTDIVDASGKDIYPGFIALNTILGLSEIEAARATNDYYEVGSLNPDVRAIIAYNTDSKVPATVRSNGVLLAQIVPEGGTISGQSSVVELDAWNWEDAAYKMDEGIHLHWPSMHINKSPNAEKEDLQKEHMEKALHNINDLFNNAKAYNKVKNPEEKNLKLESMKGLFDGTKKLYVHCNYVKEIVAAVNFSKEFDIKMILVGGDDAWRVTDLLKANDIPVVLGRTHSLPPREDEDVDLPYKLAYLLQQAGVNYCISVDGFWQVRNLSFNAGTPVAYGLTKEQALSAITLNAAKILGIDKTIGTIEVGKDATLFISDGDALDMKSNNVIHAYIRGKEINLDNIQKQLYKKYMDKYGLKE